MASVGIADGPSIGLGGDGPAVVLSGDVSATTAWAPTRQDAELFPTYEYFEGADKTMRWYAGTRTPMRYDIASYTLEYTYWAPAS